MIIGPQSMLGPHEIAFLRTAGLSMIAASRGPDNIASVARSLGCRFSADASKMTLLFCPAEAEELLQQIARDRRIAVIFSLPSTHESLQLKATDALATEPLESDRDIVHAYRQAFVEEVEKLGFSRPAIETMLACDCEDLAAVTFTPSAAFSQTPGPNAGHAIGATK
jgi:hypothetical protein